MTILPKIVTHEYDEPFKLVGDPSYQLCRREYSDGSYCVHLVGIPIKEGSVTISKDALDSQFKDCQYCNGTGMHHHREDYYWLCRNCEGFGNVGLDS